VRNLPERMKPRSVPITADGGGASGNVKQIEAAA
jgi:hypothetical protein